MVKSNCMGGCGGIRISQESSARLELVRESMMEIGWEEARLQLEILIADMELNTWFLG